MSPCALVVITQLHGVCVSLIYSEMFLFICVMYY